MRISFFKRSFLTVLGALMMGLYSCGSGDADVDVINVIQDLGGAGDFMVIDVSSHDTLKLFGGLFIGNEPVLAVKSGDQLKLVFTPADKYKDIRFNTTFTLHDGTEVTDKYEYEYTLANVKTGTYRLSLSVFFKNNSKDISASTTTKLDVRE